MKPLIGLTSYRESATWGVWSDLRCDLLPSSYADMVVRSGGVPVLLPPASDDPDAALAVVERLDGLVISGGADVDPAQYGEDRQERTVVVRPDRDAWELALLTSAAAANLPTLGVCRGMQVMAVAAGGTIDQHTPATVGHEGHNPRPGVYGETEVRVGDDSELHGILGPSLTVHCHHHQSVRSHPGYVATAWAVDGSLEAMEATGTRFCLGVQWHPEAGRDQRLFDALVAASSST
ncbi:MAG: gamma-glutamyl-gamma-aminobutyrate hydrolase family protein [Marmoricola sp.]|jgi:putative glutamine amidotransferase|nr:gamma-glutamyl-gamma-aminobutyrate hydrolase family protein [Marmoricola sp.]